MDSLFGYRQCGRVRLETFLSAANNMPRRVRRLRVQFARLFLKEPYCPAGNGGSFGC